MSRKKAWYKSRIIWFNAAAGGVAFMAAGWNELAGKLPLPEWLIWFGGGVVTAVNVGLRFITTDPVTLKRINKADGYKDDDA